MQHNAEHKKDKTALVFWTVIGLGLGIIIGASTKEWGISLISGVAVGVAMALAATKQGMD